MANNRGTRKEIIEIDARLNELERARPYMNGRFYYERTEQLFEAKSKIEKKMNDGELAPDV